MVVFLFGQCFGLSVELSIIGLVVQGFSRLWERFFPYTRNFSPCCISLLGCIVNMYQKIVRNNLITC